MYEIRNLLKREEIAPYCRINTVGWYCVRNSVRDEITDKLPPDRIISMILVDLILDRVSDD